ncbi:glycoside hydrolase domain-containing protein [Snuella sedimenti]|uniref:Glycoside hydrolase 123-like N-terminal domain-containing protein n=1 Tax=Snuella sedimenti TaxID=2798802 RepID=A0A8J7IHM8_9FLAO|nr:glycoside hydrolase domain-containing protein [Snuella sedimenti]MBJ6368598.1 hypothetical protein [Snuella sedimenti]
MNLTKNTLNIITALLLSLFTINTGAQSEVNYGIADTPWEAGFGNHRAVVEVAKKADAVKLDLNWRRHDKNPEDRRLLIINAKTGDTIPNIHRLDVNNEYCKLVFGPVDEGTYYFYYLPFKPDKEWGFYRYGYLKKEDTPSKHWMEENKLDRSKKLKKLPRAICTEIQARTDFDSFYPMEVTATQAEQEQLVNSTASDYIAIAEDRKYPIKMRNYLPLKWIKEGVTHQFEGKAQKNEYYAFQIGIYASKTNLENVTLVFHDLKSPNNSNIPASAFTCFNTHGVDPYGTPFTKQVNVKKGQIQPLWIGTDILATTESGTYKGHVTIKADNQPDKTIEIALNVSEETIADRGDNEPWRHSRLRWLNSTIGLDNHPTKPYTPITLKEENKLDLYGKQVALNEYGLPSTINVWSTEILNAPIRYNLEGETIEPKAPQSTDHDLGTFTKTYTARSENFDIQTINTTEFDGHLNYKIKLVAKKDCELNDFKLEIPFQSSIAEYMMGMGLPGTLVPQNHSAKWKGPHDSFWVGNTYGGLHVELRGGSYHGPLLNLYKPAPPESWHNGGKGGFSIEKGDNETIATIYSGQRKFEKGETLVFEVSFLITPVRKIDTKSQFVNRYYHNGLDPMPKDDEITDGVKIVNLHHASKYNPYINYPFVATKEMKSFVDQMHAKDLKVKIYYTIRELTNYTTEIWALRSLGNEILGTGKGGGYPWLQEHLVGGYRPQWYSPLENGIDASIVNAPGDSRWYNYYLEGLAWLVKKNDIDGLYLDDVSYDRRILKRMRKILDGIKPGCMMDLHSNTGFSKGPATQYTEFFPYLDKLWFGESFKYDEMPPENWLVEVSGIPFGHMGDMLHAGGNPWRGMVYGMTVRYPWFTEGVSCDPRQIWKVWDSFGIDEARMIGYWDKRPVINTSNPNVKATAYIKEGKLLVAIASWAKEPVSVKLNIDWDAVGLTKSQVKMIAPKIENYQPEQLFSVDDDLTIDPTKGWLLVVE